MIMEEKFKAFQKKELKFGSKPEQVKKTFDAFAAEAKALNEDYQKIWNYKDATWTLASFLRSGDVYYEFAQKLIKAGDCAARGAEEARQAGLQGRTPTTAAWSRGSTRTPSTSS